MGGYCGIPLFYRGINMESRGKQSYRDFTRDINQAKRWIIAAIKEGNLYTYQQVSAWLGEILYYYGEYLEAERLDYELWFNRATDKVQEVIEDISSNYPLEQENDNEGDSRDSVNDEEDYGWQDNTIFGYPIISEYKCRKENGVGRGQILTSLEELGEYIESIPPEAIYGFIPVIDNAGNEVGFRVCIGGTR